MSTRSAPGRGAWQGVEDLRSPSGGSTTLRLPSAFALGRTGVLHSSSTSVHSSLLPCGALPTGASGAGACTLSIDVRGTRCSEPRSGDGVFDRCIGRRGPCGACGGGARVWTELCWVGGWTLFWCGLVEAAEPTWPLEEGSGTTREGAGEGDVDGGGEGGRDDDDPPVFASPGSR